MSRFLLCTAFLLASAGLTAADTPAVDAPKAKAYPLDICLVTGEKLDSMGGVVTVVQDGQEYKFCCKGCIKDFNKDPAKYAAKLAEAAKAKAEPAKP